MLPRAQFLNVFKYVTRHEAVEPELEYSKNYFFELYMASAVYNALLNSSASEQASRMNVMENASKNAGEILTKLTLDYNKARQSKITMELIEIISGASILWSKELAHTIILNFLLEFSKLFFILKPGASHRCEFNNKQANMLAVNQARKEKESWQMRKLEITNLSNYA